MIKCSICGARISKPDKMVYYFYRRVADGTEYICDDCAHNFFDGHHVYGLLTGIAEADNENITISVRERVQQGSDTTD